MPRPLPRQTLLLFCALLLLAPPLLPAAPIPTVATGKKISLEYSLLLEGEETIDSNAGHEPLVYEHGSQELIPGLERALEGMRIGERKQVTLTPDEAYGPVVGEAIIEVDADKLPQESRMAGALVRLDMPDGQALEGQVTRINHARATVDFNHPLAGKTLHFDIKILDIR
ncbi:MAG: FKBP-type peptidyl-prolyl cis-trans isomerase [Thermodesulfobacteriota bacterium]